MGTFGVRVPEEKLKRIVKLSKEGLSNVLIAQRLGISRDTVRKHLEAMKNEKPKS